MVGTEKQSKYLDPVVRRHVKDPENSILKIAEFMGSKYKEILLANDDVLKKVIENSSFQKMKAVINKDQDEKDTNVPANYDMNGESIEFVRKGVIGDYLNHLTLEENEIVDKLFHEKFDGTGLEHLWVKYKFSNEKVTFFHSQE